MFSVLACCLTCRYNTFTYCIYAFIYLIKYNIKL